MPYTIRTKSKNTEPSPPFFAVDTENLVKVLETLSELLVCKKDTIFEVQNV